MNKAKSQALKKRFEDNPFAQKYKKTLEERQESREHRGRMAGIPKSLKRA